MNQTGDHCSLFAQAWNDHDSEAMLLLIKTNPPMNEALKEQERRLFLWMTKAQCIRDMAINVLSFWLIQEQTHNPALSRKQVLENHHTRLTNIVTKLQEMNILIDLLQNIISEDLSSLEASLVFLQILSPSVKLAQVLRSLFYSITDTDTCLLDSFIEIIRSYINDCSKSQHVRILSAICLLNIMSLFDFTIECQFSLSDSADTDSSPEEETRDLSSSLLQVPGQPNTKRHSKMSHQSAEPIGFRDGIIKELLILVRELRSKLKLTKIRSTLQDSSKTEFLETWEIIQFCKAVIRMFGSQQGSLFLTSPSFLKLFSALNFDIQKQLKKLQKEVLRQEKVRFRDCEDQILNVQSDLLTKAGTGSTQAKQDDNKCLYSSISFK